MNLANTVVGITGGNRGLGLALVKLLSDVCRKVIVIDKDDMCQELCFLSNIEYIQCDLLKEKPQVSEVDCFIYNAGINIGAKKARDADYDEIEKCMILNAMCPVWFWKNVKHKKFVFIDSVSAFQGLKYYSSYCASKAFVKVFNESIRKEKEDTLIVFPSKLNTKMFSEVKDFYTLDVNYVARMIVNAIKKDDKELVMPYFFKIYNCVQNFVPRVILEYILEKCESYFFERNAIKQKITSEETEALTKE